jgi:amino acid transporter
MKKPAQKIGFFGMLFLALNGIIGPGLFLLPGQVSSLVGKWSLPLYFMMSLMVLSIGWCYSRCAAHFTANGGVYLYAKEAFGDFVGFQIGLMKWVVGMVAQASLTAGFTLALSTLFPRFLEPVTNQLLTISIILGLAVVNLFGNRLISSLSSFITITKVLLLLTFLCFGFMLIDPQQLTLADLQLPKATFLGSAGLVIFYAFSGFEALAVVAGEAANPKKNIPKATLLAIVLSSLLYLVVQSISIGVLGDGLSKSVSPLTDIAEILFGFYHPKKWCCACC